MIKPETLETIISGRIRFYYEAQKLLATSDNNLIETMKQNPIGFELMIQSMDLALESTAQELEFFRGAKARLEKALMISVEGATKN